MESRVNYAVVGAFVVLLGAGLIYFVYWLGTRGGGEEYDRYRVFMSESVAGLSVDASVKYMGVAVGTVEKIMLNPDNARQVELVLKIRRGTPVTEDTTAQLKFFGVTGLAFVELVAGNSNVPLLKPGQDEMPVIPSRPSTLKRMDEALSLLAAKSATVLESVGKLLSQDNIRQFSALLTELHGLLYDVRAQLPLLKKLSDHTLVTEHDLREAAHRVSAASDSVKRASEILTERYSLLGDRLDREVTRGISQAERLFGELEGLAVEVRGLVHQLRESPADLIFRRTMPRPGPGEPGYAPVETTATTGSGN